MLLAQGRESVLSTVQGILLQACSSGLRMPGECPVCNAWDSWSWCRLPKGLEDVSKYPDLIAELLRRNWTETEVRGVLSENLLRVFSEVELVRERGHLGSYPLPTQAGCLTWVCFQASNNMQVPEEEPIQLDELGGSCRTDYGYSQAPSIHFQIGALLAFLVPLLFSLNLL